jgi:hypothetical protein
MYEAMNTAEREKIKTKSGTGSRLPNRKIKIIKGPIPHLERGTGNTKVTVRIAMCGLSKAWRHNNPDEFQKYAHLINANAIEKPDITSFLEKHPASRVNDNSLDEHNIAAEESEVNLEEGRRGEEDGSLGVNGGSDAADHLNAWTTLDYDGDEESGMVLELGGNGFGRDKMDEVGGLVDSGLELPSAPSKGEYRILYMIVRILTVSSRWYTDRPGNFGPGCRP